MDESQEPVLVFDMPLNPNENEPHMESEVDAAQLFSKANNVGFGISLMSLKENRRMINKMPAIVIIA